MKEQKDEVLAAGLAREGILTNRKIHRNLGVPQLYEETLRRNEGTMARGGALVVDTGRYTGRSPDDKFIVKDKDSEDKVWWSGGNRPFSSDQFDALHQRVLAHLNAKELFVRDCFVGADPEYRMSLRVITESAWHSLFAGNMFLRPTEDELARFTPEFTVLHAPGLLALPKRDGTNSEAFIIVNYTRRLVIIGGTRYAGEIKKSVFSVMNYLLPQRDVLPMHCAANQGLDEQDVALFFGLSGTGKTTLSVVADRILIGDDEHGWGNRGVFNFEGGCYAKVIRLSQEAEPEIFSVTQTFGTVLENVGMDPVSRDLDLDDDSKTENTRCSYPMSHIASGSATGLGKHPATLFLLTADAFGVMPPIAKLTPDQAMYYFLSGYTAKVAGTERGVTEPEATFSTCFGAPFMPLHPSVYAQMLGERIDQHQAQSWLVNTGWSGGPYGVGKRVNIAHTRAMIRAALNGALASVETRVDPIFALEVPLSCPDVPADLLNPRNTWADPQGYDSQARKLAVMFKDNFVKFADQVSPEVRTSGPISD